MMIFPNRNISLGLVEADNPKREGSVLGVETSSDFALESGIQGCREVR